MTARGEWTPERVALLSEQYADQGFKLLGEINAMPGAPIASVKAMSAKAREIGVGTKRGRPPAVEAPLPDDPGIARYIRAKRLIEQRKDPAAVAAVCRIPLWRAFGIVGEIRRERAGGVG